VSSSTSPVVLSQITTSYRARFASVNAAASSVASTRKWCRAPSCRIATVAAGIESCRKAAVLEKTSALNRGWPAAPAPAGAAAAGATGPASPAATSTASAHLSMIFMNPPQHGSA
jgi:hypothetical protein